MCLFFEEYAFRHERCKLIGGIQRASVALRTDDLGRLIHNRITQRSTPGQQEPQLSSLDNKEFKNDVTGSTVLIVSAAQAPQSMTEACMRWMVGRSMHGHGHHGMQP